MAAVPAKPVMTVAVAITAAVAGWHFWSVHDLCTGRADLTGSLKQWSAAALAGADPSRLDTATSFEWDHVRFLEGAPKPAKSLNCPFGWHWNNEAREALAKAGNLTQIGFFKDKRVVELADFDRRWARFDAGTEAISKANAVFVPGGAKGLLKLKGR